jgi:hypothetical protein
MWIGFIWLKPIKFITNAFPELRSTKEQTRRQHIFSPAITLDTKYIVSRKTITGCSIPNKNEIRATVNARLEEMAVLCSDP